jgi:ribosome-associated translation inhibitor RaiA
MPLFVNNDNTELEVELAKLRKVTDQVIDFLNAMEKRVIESEQSVSDVRKTVQSIVDRLNQELAFVKGKLDGKDTNIKVDAGTNFNSSVDKAIVVEKNLGEINAD